MVMNIYFYIVILVCIAYRYTFPLPRFVRFHMIRGVMLIAFQGIPDQIFQMLQFSEH